MEPRLSVEMEEGTFLNASASPVAPAGRGGAAVPSADHRKGIAELLAGQPRKALANLTTAASASNRPAAWNDLAAAYHETALQYDSPELLANALACTDQALSLDSHFAPALFNRALIIEKLGLRTDARKAWSSYLAVDGTTGWATRAQRHLGALKPATRFQDVLDREYDHVIADPAAAQALYEQDPFGVRAAGIMRVLGRWGNAVLRGDERDAMRHLTVARHLGAVVARGGERMLQHAVAAIDRSEGETRLLLAHGHADYEAGLAVFQEQQPVAAEKLLRRAAAAFDRAGSPMRIAALHFAANTVYEQGDHDASEKENVQLLAATPDDYPAYRAVILWQLGICHRSRGDWGAALTSFKQSASLFAQLGETQNTAVVEGLLAFVYDRIGAPRTAWEHRIAPLRRGSRRTSSLVDEKIVSSIAETAILRHDWHTAASFLTLHIGLARRLHDDVQVADSLMLRAVVRDRLRDRTGVNADMREARAAASAVKDPAFRAALAVGELRARAMLSGTPPVLAEELLTKAIAARTTRSDPASPSDLLLQRARARRSAGDAVAAMQDVEAGIEDLERTRETLPEGEIRWGAFHAAEELFDEAVELALEARDAGRAFRFAERGRARALLDLYGSRPVVDWRRLPDSTVVVEYVSLPARLVIFTVDGSGVRASMVTEPRDALARQVDDATRALHGKDPTRAKRAASELYRRLIAPIAPQLVSANTVVFVPDTVTATVPFSALRDPRGVFFIESHAVVIAASAAAFAAGSERRRGASMPRTALVISAPDSSGDSGSLAFVEAEARAVTRVYGRATQVRTDQPQLDELRLRAPGADIIHFAGHAIGDDSGLEASSIVLEQGGRERRVTVPELARLKLRRACTVVLAGCSTAQGERRGGVISVAHGFLAAGAPSVIATLWPIDDDVAALFFPRIHRHLSEGMSPPDALRAAQLESIRRGDIPVSLWAAVQSIGS